MQKDSDSENVPQKRIISKDHQYQSNNHADYAFPTIFNSRPAKSLANMEMAVKKSVAEHSSTKPEMNGQYSWTNNVDFPNRQSTNSGGSVVKSSVTANDMDSVEGPKTFNSRTFERFVPDENSHRGSGPAPGPSSSNSNRNKKITPFMMLLSEDMRISKILRRLLDENTSASALELCGKLETAVRNQSNMQYICRSFDTLAEQIIIILKQAPVPCLRQMAMIFGLMGYVNRGDFPVYKNYIVKNYASSRSIQKYLMLSLKTIFSCDAINKDLSVYSERMLIILKEYLENADLVDNFMAVSDTIVEFSKHYKRSFEKHFTDIVDIIVGWHLETEQSQSLKHYCSTVLQSLSEYFVKKLDFTFGLLGQFLEDIQAACDDINSLNKSPLASPELSVGAFVGAFNSIMKSLATPKEFIAFTVGKNLLKTAVIVITSAAKQSLKNSSCGETVYSVNEFFTLIFSNYNKMEDPMLIENIEDIIQIEINNMDRFDVTLVGSLLFLVLTIVNQLKANTPIHLVSTLLKMDGNFLTRTKLTQNDRNFKLLVKIYHEILMIKNVPLLLEAYRHILMDMEVSIDSMSTEENGLPRVYTLPQAESVLTFYFSALANLATQTSSIIGMYALNPSILELLITNCQSTNMKIWSTNPTLHTALISLLAAHCQKNHNYRMSSRLLTENLFAKLSLDESSPTSENFSRILQFLAEVLTQAGHLSETNLKIILSWVNNLLKECKESAHLLKDHQPFIEICDSLCTTSILQPVECAECIATLQTYDTLKSRTLMLIRGASISHLQSTNARVRETYCGVFGRLPLNVSLLNPDQDLGVFELKHTKASELQQWYISTAFTAGLKERYFPEFIDKVSLNSECTTTIDRFIKDIFPKCWVAELREKASDYFRTCLGNQNMLISWIQWEAARYCVKNKLRTKLGKPQDTFLKIESIIMKYARVLALKDSSKVQSDAELIANEKHARILLGFLECLEKCIYNAAEGTAFALQAQEKPAKTFFRVNTPTCKEWFNRIRTAVNLIAIHCMEPQMVVRYSETMLRSLVTSGKTSDTIFDHTVMSLVWALLKCKEPDSLQGLYVWIKMKTGKRYQWIKYASEHASGRREVAADGYASVLASDEKIDSHVREFLGDQMFDCLYFTNQWVRLRNHLGDVQSEKRDTLPVFGISPNQLEVMENLYHDYNADISVLELSKWENLETKPKELSSNFSCYKVLSSLRSTLTASTLSGDGSDLAVCSKLIKAGLQESMQKQYSEHLHDFTILNHVACKLQDKNDACDTFDAYLATEDSATLTKCVNWAQFFARKQGSDIKHSMYLNVASVARKDGNHKLCRSELERFFQVKGVGKNIDELFTSVLQNEIKLDIGDTEILRGFSEMSKCMYTNVERQGDAVALASACCLQVIEQVSTQKATQYPETVSRMLLTLSEWLPQQFSDEFLLDDKNGGNSQQHLRNLLISVPDISGHPDEDFNEIIPPIDMAVGKLIQASVLQCDYSGRSWSAFGNWCYRWGKKLVEAKTEDNCDKAGLSQRDIELIKEFIANITDDDVAAIVQVLDKHQVTATEDEDIEANEISSTELIENQLRKIPILKEKPVTAIMSIIQIWRQAHKSVYVYYEMAAEAYFKYLSLSSSHDAKSGDCSLVTATLRLLRLVVKHAFGLQEVLEEGLSYTPTRPWKVIVPQLFSRLNHHEPYVRKRVSELLCRVAEDTPHLIIFPAVVGAFQEHKKDEITTNDELNPLTYCFNSLLTTLSNQAAETVEQVQLLVRELKRVTLLWDEFWIHSLTQLYNEYSHLFNALELEAKKPTAMQNYSSLNAKHTILMTHIADDLKKLFAVTSKPAETNYERNFQEKYSNIIETTIEELNKPLNLAKVNESWQKLKQLYTIFQQRLQKNSQSALKMLDISPVLANMRNTAISMPGVETTENEPIFIKAVDNTVYILPTKTKPKKLAFFGSNGKRYTYLFKGLEDLHLDERIMQFLSISNSMMARTNTNVYRAHHYSVIPLGPQSGLISWVDGVTPLFGIYKKWQQREAASKDRNGVLLRPSEMFYSKLSPLLAEKNIKVTDSRKTWPLATLRQVLDELSKETPRDLLAKELWCHSDNCATWRESIRKYSLSVAVTSVIGYVIGLGDRHLDNVLVKLTTGEIVHIDYNVCFEKGKTLRVPEKVPFRMTPNLEEALGVTGTEGAFRLGCEHVLKTLRKERETLLTLLEAFVYDPLVDWAVGDDGTTTSSRSTTALAAAVKIAALKASSALNSAEDCKKKKKTEECKKTETEVTRNTILARFTEIKPYWTQYRDEVIYKLQQVLNSLKDLEDNRESIHQAEMERDALTKQLAMIRELETLGSAMGSHALNTISQRYSTYKKAADEFSAVKANITDYQKDLKATTTLYFHTLLGATGLGELNSLRRVIQCTKPTNEFDIVKELLENSAQNVLYGKSDFARKEMDNTLQQQGKAAFICTDAINQYVQVMRFYPHSKLRKSRLVKYERLYRDLLEGHKEPAQIKDELHTLASEQLALRRSPVFVDLVVGYATKLEQMWIEANFTLRTFNIPSEQNVVAEQQENLNENRNLFLSIGIDALHSLRFATLKHIVQSNSEMFLFETSTVDVLDYQINYIQYLQSSQYIFELSPDVLNLLTSVETAFLAIRSLRLASNCKIPSLIVELFMINDDEDLLAIIGNVLGANGNPPDLCFKKEMSGLKKSSLNYVLSEIQRCFESCQKTLNEARKTVSMATNWEQFLSAQVNNNFQKVVSELLNPGPDYLEQNKMLALLQVFSAAKQQTESLCNSHVDNLYDVRAIGQPIRALINGIQEKVINGLTSLVGALVIEDLNSRYLNSFPDIYSLENHLHNAKDLAERMFVFHQRKCSLGVMQTQLDLQLEIVEHLTLIASAHFWANELHLRTHTTPFGHIIPRDKLLATMQSSRQSLSVWKITMEKIQAEIDENTCAIIPRLKWAAGANPNMKSVKDQFEEMSSIQMEKFRAHTSLSNTLMEFTGVIVQFELFRAENKEMDSMFLDAVSQWEETNTAERRVASLITPTEQSIVQLLDPEGTVDQCWIDNISGLLDEMTYGVHRQIADLEKCAQNIQEQVFCCSSDLQSLMDTQLRVDIRQLLKLFSKVDSESQSTARVREFQYIYRQFFAQLNDLNMKILCRDFAEANVRQMFEQANDLIRDVEQNHTDLIDLVEDFHTDSMDRRNVGGPIQNDPKKGNQREQKRNAYAVSVWKRIRMKLEGRDPDPNRRCTISEQVDYMIREATNPDNLAVLYEGWTPWV
ncbi:serine/threonine-protein kinase Smg1 [Eupeodes corollae]|uniref:serine/threonine-protein kinase Smg1 n=1 Tax=Eupeodes corollae TaxID=290404 RepID=UPI00248F6BEB|nr:serine/threonine-protein kinase Smg1 [Eupeodes corollae]